MWEKFKVEGRRGRGRWRIRRGRRAGDSWLSSAEQPKKNPAKGLESMLCFDFTVGSNQCLMDTLAHNETSGVKCKSHVHIE